MIQSIKLNNFQNHIFQEFVFNSGVNILSGKTDSGKSAITRAVNWIVNNQPNGSDFIHNDFDECWVVLIFGNDKIKRVKNRDGSVNSYFLNDEEYKAFGQNVPDKIKNTFNMNYLNFQYQFDSPFMVHDSSGSIAKYLNDVLSLSDIDNCIGNINSQIKDTNKTLVNFRNNEKEIEGVLKSIPDLESMKNEIDQFENRLKKLEIRKLKLNKLESISNELVDLNKKMKDFKDFDRLFIENILNLYIRKQKMEIIKSQYNDLTKSMKCVINSINQVNNILPENYICPLCKK